jgi:REP-associated tyrosine transposase
MRARQPAHLPTFNYRGLHRYSLTFCTDRRRRLFTRLAAVTLVLSQIVRAAAQEQFAILAYCFMPDHVHLLVEGLTDRSDGLRFIARAKQYSGFHYARIFGKRLWQRYGYEHVLRSDEVTLQVARYILENPIRAGIVRRVEDYPFVGSKVHPIAWLLEETSRVSSQTR